MRNKKTKVVSGWSRPHNHVYNGFCVILIHPINCLTTLYTQLTACRLPSIQSEEAVVPLTFCLSVSSVVPSGMLEMWRLEGEGEIGVHVAMWQIGLHFGLKKTGTLSIIFKDLSRNSWTEVKPSWKILRSIDDSFGDLKGVQFTFDEPTWCWEGRCSGSSWSLASWSGEGESRCSHGWGSDPVAITMDNDWGFSKGPKKDDTDILGFKKIEILFQNKFRGLISSQQAYVILISSGSGRDRGEMRRPHGHRLGEEGALVQIVDARTAVNVRETVMTPTKYR